MGEKTTISYIQIPNEISLLVDIVDKDNIDVKNIKDNIKKYDNISCVVFICDLGIGKQIKEVKEALSDYKLKYGWFTNRTSIPFMADEADYIKLQNVLYAKINNETNSNINKASWIEIHQLSKKDLNPVDPYYFEMFDELSSTK